MSTLINLVISFIIGALFGHQMKEPKTAHGEFKKNSVELYQHLKIHQKILEC